MKGGGERWEPATDVTGTVATMEGCSERGLEGVLTMGEGHFGGRHWAFWKRADMVMRSHSGKIAVEK